MKKKVLLILYAKLGIYLLLQVNASAQEIVRTPPHRPLQPPAGFNLAIKIKEWKVIDHRIIDYDQKWGQFRFVGKHNFAGELVFKLKSNKYAEHYWMVRIPSVKEGIYECRTQLYVEPKPGPNDKPPKRFLVVMVIKNGKVLRHFIKNSHPTWGEFVVSGYKKTILYLQNPFYPGCVWAARMPSADGKWTIYPTLLEGKEES